jgi:hypothetical protein
VEFKINYILNDKYIRISSSGVITGQLSISINNQYFPSQFWDDFIIRVLDMWLDSTIKLLEGSSVEDFAFMDGSYSFLVRVVPDNKFHIRCIEDYKETDLHTEVAIKDFVTNLLSGSRDILRFIKEKKWNSNLSYFESLINKLESVLEEI